MQKSHITLIIPAYNEEKRIAPTLQAYAEYFDSQYGEQYDLLVVLNGCRDNTEAVVQAAEQKHPRIQHITIEEAIGKGGAIIEGFKIAKGELVGYTDADGSTAPATMDRLFVTLARTPELSCVAGSRRMPGSVVHNRTRSLMMRSWIFNMITRVLFWLGVRDTQCGAKVVRASMLPQIVPNLKISNMAFDVNLLVDVRRAGGQILEMPIEWSDEKNSTITAPMRTAVGMVLSLCRLRLIYSPFKFLYPVLSPISDALYKFFFGKAPQ